MFTKHNFYVNGFTPEELRTTLEDLGPTYVKIGQIMSSRTDMLPESYCKELEKVTEEELDFRVEAENTRKFRAECITDQSMISCPTIIDDLTTERILTMTFVDGYSISRKERVEQDGYDRVAIGTAIAENFLYQVLDVGTFHGDPHQGNIMISHGVPYWIDFGMIGHVTQQSINCMRS